MFDCRSKKVGVNLQHCGLRPCEQSNIQHSTIQQNSHSWLQSKKYGWTCLCRRPERPSTIPYLKVLQQVSRWPCSLGPDGEGSAWPAEGNGSLSSEYFGLWLPEWLAMGLLLSQHYNSESCQRLLTSPERWWWWSLFRGQSEMRALLPYWPRSNSSDTQIKPPHKPNHNFVLCFW